MKKIVLIFAAVLAVTASASAQSPYPTPTRTRILPPSRPVPSRPIQSPSSTLPRAEVRRPALVRADSERYRDQLAIADGEEIYLRTGTGIELPKTDGAPLVLRLDSPLNTSGMKGVPMSRNIPLRSPILTRYAQVIAPKDILVETNIVGEGARFKDRAELVIQPQMVMVDIDSYVLVGEKDGRRVFLKPGKWAIKLHCNILSVENPDGHSWYAKSDHEGLIKGGRFGFSGKGPSVEEHFSGLIYLNPYGPVLYGVSQVKGLFGFVFKRPNIKLPERTEINYRIERMEATYLSAPMPKGPAKIVDQ